MVSRLPRSFDSLRVGAASCSRTLARATETRPTTRVAESWRRDPVSLIVAPTGNYVGGIVAQREEMRPERAVGILAGFRNFLMQGDIIIIAIGLVIALAFSTLIKAFTDNVITPLVNAAGGA
jgi:Large-conductance mechanosensitive channel, MscL